jgi:SAM-dependent methyltransferase
MTIPPGEPVIGRRHFVGIFLLCFATLLLELALTRVLSVTLWYHFGFLVISTALLGFGASGVTLALWRGLREEAPLDRTLAILVLLFGVLVVACFWVQQRLPFDPFNLLTDARQFWLMPLYFLVVALPFYCAGLALALLLTRGAGEVNRLYAADLLGAGLGCAAIALVMPRFGGAGSVVIAAAIGLAAAVAFGWRHARAVALVGAALALGAVLLAFLADSVLPLSITPNKRSPKETPIFTAWNTFSRIDFYHTLPNEQRAYDRFVFVFDAGTAFTGIRDLRPDFRAAAAKLTDPLEFESQVAYLGRSQPSVLIIGSGAGQQVLDAVQYGAGAITAIDVNPIINAVITGPLQDSWGGLFAVPEVRLVTAEGRSFVRRSPEQYDAIISVHTISNSAIASGALSLTENYVLTREAFEDYLDHLTPDGVIYFTRPESQIARLFATGREVLEARGATDVPAHFYAFGGRSDADPEKARRNTFNAGFLLKKTPFTAEEIRAIDAFLRVDAADGENARLYTPLDEPADTIYQRLLKAPDLREVYAANRHQIAPATDNRPFFNQRTRWSSIDFATIRDLFSQGKMGRMALEDRPVAEVTLLVLLVQVVVIAGVLILLPLLRFKRADLRAPGRGRMLVYFAGLGLGFIFIEVVFLQHFTLFLGEPVYTFAVVLAGLLLWTGLGAFLSDKLAGPARGRLRRIIPWLLAMLVATALLTPPIFQAALGLPLGLRIAISLAIIAPLGVMLGMPFPTGLRVVAEEAPGLVPWAWGINGFFTVIGTILALMFAMMFGFLAVLVIAGACYVAAWLALSRASADRATC